MYKKINHILGALSFILPFILYISTMAPTTSFWDCGEFIATSYILGVPHPPGSPLFLLLGNVFSQIPLFADIGARVNILSPLASALSVMFLYYIIVYLIEEFNGKSENISKIIINNMSAFIAALTFAVTDSHWFNAVESEVYALSTFFTAIVIWIILKWNRSDNTSWQSRYLLLIAYMLGLAIGIHILNLLTLPFILLIIYFKKYDFSIIGLCSTIFLTLITFILIYYGVILGVPDLVSKFQGLNILILGILLIICSTILLHLKNYYYSLTSLAKYLSIISILFISLLIFNKLFIKSANQIISSYDNKLSMIDASIVYFLDQEGITEEDLYRQNIDANQKQYLETLKKERTSIIKEQIILKKKKESRSYIYVTASEKSLKKYKIGLKEILGDNIEISQQDNARSKSNFLIISSIIENKKLALEKMESLIPELRINDITDSTFGFFKLLLWQSGFIIIGLFSVIIFIVPTSIYILNIENKSYTEDLKVFLSCFLLIMIGYSSYVTIFIRANQGPNINENNPNNLNRALAYINRDQYGAIEPFDTGSAIFSSSNGASHHDSSTPYKNRWAKDKYEPTFIEKIRFRVKYQINEMYLRYFSWQFIGRSDKGDKPWLIKDLDNKQIGMSALDGIDFYRYGLPLALIFGLFGLFFQFNRDWKRALALLSVFLSTGIMLVLYLNQYDPQPRERDYSYVGSFFIFSIWIGLGISFMQQKIKDFFEDSNISAFISITITCFIFILMTFTMAATDYKEHSRRGNYVAWDYGYNLLNSCEPNAIIFTNGDNDTFPLWYLQEVEKIRTDVRVVNLSLLNTPWYIEQLINIEPKLELQFKNPLLDNDIYKIDNNYTLSTAEGYSLCSQDFNTITQYWDVLDCNLKIEDNGIIKNNFEFKLPSYKRQVLRIQDYMILQIINDLYLKKPIYFAATVAETNQIGLNRYLEMQGMVYKIIPNKIDQSIPVKINYDKMKLNLTQSSLIDTIKTADDYLHAINNNKGIYRYHNLDNPNIFYNSNIIRILQNYRIGYLRLMEDQLKKNNISEVKLLIKQFNDYFPINNIPMDPWLGFELIDKIYSPVNDLENQKQMLNHLVSNYSDVNIKLLSIMKSLDLEFYELTEELINKYVINSDIAFERKIALVFQAIEDIGYHNSFDSLLVNILDEYDKKAADLSIEDKYRLLGILYQTGDTDGTIKLGKNLLLFHYDSDLNNIDMQKYIGEILLDVMGTEIYIKFCQDTFINNKIEGLLYVMVNVYIENGDYELAKKELNLWLEYDPTNQRMINKKNKVLEYIPFE